jgi:general secretion pathway protein A
MYEGFYGFRERPFDLTPNPRFLLLTGKHREALSNLQYGLQSRRGLTLLVGEAGTGKTTLIRAAIEQLEKDGAILAYLNNPMLSRGEFGEFLSGAFNLTSRAAASKTTLLKELAVVLEQRRAADQLTGLIIDEAQALPDELLEEVRLLANIETATDKLLPIVLAGQPELADRLNQVSLRQLKQRVALRCHLDHLSARETAEYIAGRIRVAGGNSVMVFTRQAVDAIFERSSGIPRLISVICDNALISGFAADRRPVGRDIVDDVCRDFDLLPGGAPHPPAAPPSSAVKALEPADPRATAKKADPAKKVEAAEAGKPEARGLFAQFNVRRRFPLF